MTKVPDIAFDEYIRTGEPDRQEKASIWQAAIGLQAVDGLQTSEYLKETARKHYASYDGCDNDPKGGFFIT